MPVDHEMFDDINSAQWLWYMYNVSKDQEEKYIFKRDFTEYLASFIEPEAVQKIRLSREKAVAINDENFSRSIKDMFGRELPGAEALEKDDKTHSVNIAELMKNINDAKQEKSDSAFNYQHWTQFELE